MPHLPMAHLVIPRAVPDDYQWIVVVLVVGLGIGRPTERAGESYKDSIADSVADGCLSFIRPSVAETVRIRGTFFRSLPPIGKGVSYSGCHSAWVGCSALVVSTVIRLPQLPISNGVCSRTRLALIEPTVFHLRVGVELNK